MTKIKKPSVLKPTAFKLNNKNLSIACEIRLTFFKKCRNAFFEIVSPARFDLQPVF